MVVLFLLPLLAAARWRTALNFGVTYAVLTALGMLDPDAWDCRGACVSALAVGVTMMLPCFITGAYTFTTTSASAFICAMRRMRVPEAVVIPCVVVIRFFPTIAEDYRQIRNAMALRGIASGGWGLVRHPAQSLEYILIPLLMNATNVAQDLSVAALTKGLGREGEHTSRTLIRMTVVDWLVMIVVTLPLALDIAGVDLMGGNQSQPNATAIIGTGKGGPLDTSAGTIASRGISFTYDHAAEPALRDITLTVPAGECIVLCGASGCGKTSYTRVANGLIPHSSMVRSPATRPRAGWMWRPCRSTGSPRWSAACSKTRNPVFQRERHRRARLPGRKHRAAGRGHQSSYHGRG